MTSPTFDTFAGVADFTIDKSDTGTTTGGLAGWQHNGTTVLDS